MSMPESQRWGWIGLLLLAGDSLTPGYVGISDEIGYNNEQLCKLIATDEMNLINTLRAMKKSVEISENKVIKILKWEEYQSEYQRQSKYRQGYNPRLQPKVQHQMLDVQK